MRKDYLLGVFFFGSLWGCSEAVLGGFLYGRHIDHSSVPLTVVAFMILTVAKLYFPQRFSATLMGSVAMLYKFLNTPFFACHLLAIFLLGLSYDLVFSAFRIKNKAIVGLAATYLGYILFGFAITYVFRYRYWITEGLPKILYYVGTSGTMAAFANFIAVPLSFRFGVSLKSRIVNPFEVKSRLALGSLSFVILALWALNVIAWS